MSIKLIAVDIDGTLLNSQRQVTPEVFQAIQDAKAAGVKVVIATGRPIPGVLPLLEELNLNQDGDYVITFNGGLVQETSTGNELIRETLSYEDYLDIEDEETETWLGRGRLPCALNSRLDVKVLLAEPSYLEEITQHDC